MEDDFGLRGDKVLVCMSQVEIYSTLECFGKRHKKMVVSSMCRFLLYKDVENGNC